MSKLDISEQWLEDQNDPDNWLRIPDFGVKPVDVVFTGFAFPIVSPLHHEGLPLEVRNIVRGLRQLARAEFSSLSELREACNSAMDLLYPIEDDGVDVEPRSGVVLTKAQVMALRYTFIMRELEVALHLSHPKQQQCKPLVAARRAARAAAAAASMLMDWLTQSPMNFSRESLERMRLGASQGGKASAQARRAASSVPAPKDLRDLRDDLIRNGRDQRDIAGILASRFGCTADNIRKTLKKRD